MKKFYLFMLLILFSFAMVACGETTTEVTTAAPTTEAATTVEDKTIHPTTEVPTTEAPTTDAPTTEVPTTEAPTTVVGELTWTGESEVTVVRGNAVDLYEGITVNDTIDGDLTEDITITDDDGFTSSLAGGYVITYSVTNSTGITSTFTRSYTVYVAYNVANGDFAIPSYGWTLDTPGGGATLSFVDESAEIEISNAGNAWWGVQLYQSNIIFEAGVTYKISVDASSDDRVSIAVGFEDINNGYSMLNPGFQAFELSSTSETFDVYYTSTDDVSNVKVVIYMGWMLPGDEITTANQTLTLDNINIEVVDPAQNIIFTGVDDLVAYSGAINFDPLAGVSAEDLSGTDLTADIVVTGVVPNEVMVPSTYYVTYMVELQDGTFSFVHRRISVEFAKDYEYQTINGDFDNGLNGWTQDVIQTQGTGEATFTDNGDGTVSITVDNVSDAGWHIQLQQAASTFKSGETYVVTITLKASAARNVTIEVVDPNNGFAPVAPGLNAVPVGTDWITYEIHFTADQDYSDIKLGLLLGNVDMLQQNGITVTVDQFQVYKYDPWNEEFNDTNEPWVYDNIDATLIDGEIVATFVNTGEVGQVAGSDPWNNQLYQTEGLELIAGHTYEVEVYLKSSVARTIRAWIEDAAASYAGIATGPETEVTLGVDTYTLLTYTVTITEANATDNAKFVIMFGDVGIAGVAHTVTIDYFKVTDITNQD